MTTKNATIDTVTPTTTLPDYTVTPLINDENEPLVLPSVDDDELDLLVQQEKAEIQRNVSQDDIDNLVFKSCDDDEGTMADIVEVPTEYLLPKWLELGKVSLFIGPSGTGKSFLLSQWVATVTNGGTWFNGSECVKGGVVVASLEEDVNGTLLRRYKDAHVDLTQVKAIKMVIDETKKVNGIARERMFSLPEDKDYLERKIRAIHASLVILDPISQVFGKGYTDKGYMREQMAMLNDIAERNNCAILCVSHPKPGRYNEKNIITAVGNEVVYQVARSVILASKDLNNEEHINLQHQKSSNGKTQKSTTYEIVENKKGEVFVRYTLDNRVARLNTGNMTELHQWIQAYLLYVDRDVSLQEFIQVGQRYNFNTIKSELRKMVENGTLAQPCRGWYNFPDKIKVIEAMPTLLQIEEAK